MTNKGIENKNSAYSSTINTSDLDSIMNNFSDTAEFYDKQMIKYLKQNSDSYPNYTSPGTGWDTINPVDTTYDSGIWLGDMDTPPQGIDIDYGRFRNC